MVQHPASRPSAPAARPASAAASVPAVDPVKILKKYVWLLVAALIFGILAGFAGNFALLRYRPVWRADVRFRVEGPKVDVAKPRGEITIDEREFERFMQTQVATVVSPTVFDRVIQDPRLPRLAPRWAGKFQTPSGGIDPVDARADLAERTVARVMENTQLFVLTVGWRSPEEARELANLISEKYRGLLASAESIDAAQQTDAVRSQIAVDEQTIQQLEADKGRLIQTGNVDSVNEQATEAARALLQLSVSINEARNERALVAEQIEIRRQSVEAQQQGGALQFNALLRAQVAQLPQVNILQQRLQALQTDERSLELQGFAEEHRARKSIRRQIEAVQAELDDERERQLEALFFAELDDLEEQKRQYDAQIADLSERLLERRTEQIDLTRTLEEIRSIDRRLDALGTQLLNRQAALSVLEAAGTDSRVEELAPGARARDKISSPQITTSLAVAIFLCVGGTAGLVILREVLDQRIKGASDVALIPRTRVLGVVPLAAEDPSNPKHFETIVRDVPRGVLAECFRQLSTVTLKRMRAAGARSLLVVPASPGSGATSVVSNLAFAAAAVDQRVLIIDANFRRPNMHNALGVEYRPGLADILAREATMEECARPVCDRVSVLPVGSAKHRVFERLSTSQMSELLTRASESYDLVLLDVAPAVVSGDAVALANQCDASIMVVRALAEKRGMVARLRNDLADVRAEMLGVLVNAVRASAGGYMRRNIRTAHAYQGVETETPDPDRDDQDPGGEPGEERSAA